MAKKPIGAKVWIIPDSYLPEQSAGELKSHESTCVLNLSSRPAKVKLTVYFEDREPPEGFEAAFPPLQTVHIRLDRLKSCRGEAIPVAKPTALKVESDVAVVVQHTWLDTTQPALALMTAVAFPSR